MKIQFKLNYLVVVCLLFTTLLNATPLEQAEDESYKHDKQTHFVIKDNNTYYLYYHQLNGDIKSKGYLNYDGNPNIVSTNDYILEENNKHLSDTYFSIFKGDSVFIYYKNYSSKPELVTGELVSKLVNDKRVKHKNKLTPEEFTHKMNEVTSTNNSETSEEDEEDDDGISFFHWIFLFIVAIVWLVLIVLLVINLHNI